MNRVVALGEAELPITLALKRMLAVPEKLRAFVIIEHNDSDRFVQFCTGGFPAAQGRPLIFDVPALGVTYPCDSVEDATERALSVLRENYKLDDAALLTIIENTTYKKPERRSFAPSGRAVSGPGKRLALDRASTPQLYSLGYMSRAISASFITFATSASALNPALTESHFIQSADPGDMQDKFAAQVADFQARNATQASPDWVLTHLDLAGGGDGHTFVLATQWALSASISSDGLQPSPTAIPIGEFFLAASQAELPAARRRAQQAIAALLPATTTADTSVEVLQTLFAGASQGTSFMGLVLAVHNVPSSP